MYRTNRQFTYSCLCVGAHARVCVCVCLCVCVRVRPRAPACMRVCVRAYGVCLIVCVERVCVRERSFVRACMHACVRACVRTRVYYKHPCTSCNGGLTMGHELFGPRCPGCRQIQDLTRFNKIAIQGTP